MKANLMDLNNVLFERIERLNDDDLVGDELENELKKSKAIGGIASTIVQNSSLILRAVRYEEESIADPQLPKLFIGDGK